jgi:hypothetical protein
VSRQLSENEVRFLRKLDSGNRGSMNVELIGPGFALLGYTVSEDTTAHGMTCHELDYWLRCQMTSIDRGNGFYPSVSGGKGGLTVHVRAEHLPRLRDMLEAIPEHDGAIFSAKPAAEECLRGKIEQRGGDLYVAWVVWGARRFDVAKSGSMVARFRRKVKDPQGFVTDKELWDFLYAPKRGLRGKANELLGDHTTSFKRKDDTNCGECCICEGVFKLTDSLAPKVAAVGTLVMVDHGYQMTGYDHTGERVNRCFGVRHQPYQKSREPVQLFLLWLEPQVDSAKETSAFLRGPDVKELTRMVSLQPLKMETYTPEHPRWKDELSRAQREADARRDSLLDLQRKMKKRAADWKLQPLPDEIRAGAVRIP